MRHRDERRRARDLAKPPVYVHGMGQAHRFDLGRADLEIATRTPAVESGRAAFAMAGCTPADVTVCELYDCYTYTVLVTFEDYGFCAKGEGGPFVADGRLGPGGALPTNTGGGELSSFYLWGMTPLSEGVIQGRGEGGARQVPRQPSHPRVGQRRRSSATTRRCPLAGGGVSDREVPPLLEADARSAPFFEAAARGRLLLQRCTECRAWHFPVRRRCPACGARRSSSRRLRGAASSTATRARTAHPIRRCASISRSRWWPSTSPRACA